MRRSYRLPTLLVALAVLGVVAPSAARAADPPSGAGAIEFNRDIRAILADKCFACHGFDGKKRQADLRLDTFEGATADHDGTRAIVPGDLSKSELWKRVTSQDPDVVMPPPKSNKKLSDLERDRLKRWIEQGAPYQKHWAFEAPRKVAPPAISPDGQPASNPAPAPGASAASTNPIDAFLLARLRRDGRSFSPEAPRETLIRRVSFALTGLPPTPAEVDEYLNDKSPDAYRAMLERYLKSPRYGEEMARHWLDVARYADTHGLHLDNERQMWAYRDYVVKAFNDNKQFDQFTIEQIAGDLLPNATREQIVATGFNRCNVTTSEGGSINDELVYRYAVDRTSTMVEAWLGLSGGCCVCHDHKFDPISTKDFYSLYAFFNSAADPGFDGNAVLTPPTLRLPTAEQDKQLAELATQLAAKQKQLDERTAAATYVDPATIEPRPPVETVETVWLDDDFPANAKYRGQPGAPTQWVVAGEGAQVLSGKRALKRSEPGLGQDFYEEGAAPLTIPPSGELFVHVWLDPQNPPKAVMLQYNKGGWKHRAVWGDYEIIPWGAVNTVERVGMGPLPATGKWEKLAVPAAKLGLQGGDQITGFALTQHGGTVFWDKVGVSGRTDPAGDPARSISAWRKQFAGKDAPGAPAEVNKLLKGDPAAALKDDDAKVLRNYYLQNVCADTRREFAPLLNELADLRRQREAIDKAVPSTFVFNDLAKPRDSFVMVRGQYDKPGDKVEPATPAILHPLKKASPDGRATRLDLANWLVAAENPLSARVTVNRFWQQFFGVGLVKSSGDFGSQGELPSHPELLDWLAVNFRENRWDVKDLLRLMLTSQAFRQSSRATAEMFAYDPENRLLARGPRFRLDAEQIRDNALFTSGLIDFTMGGKGVNPYQPPNIWEPVGFVGSNTRFYKQDTGSALYRRSLYTFLKRTAPPPFMVNFDGPNREQFCLRRERSNTPLQALQLMNDVQHFEAARALAERMVVDGGATPAERIAYGYRVILSRRPTDDETQIVAAELERHLAIYSKDEEAAKRAIAHGESKPKTKTQPAELAAYTLVANMLLNLDETLNRN